MCWIHARGLGIGCCKADSTRLASGMLESSPFRPRRSRASGSGAVASLSIQHHVSSFKIRVLAHTGYSGSDSIHDGTNELHATALFDSLILRVQMIAQWDENADTIYNYN